MSRVTEQYTQHTAPPLALFTQLISVNLPPLSWGGGSAKKMMSDWLGISHTGNYSTDLERGVVED